jgi:hypothetical protein
VQQLPRRRVADHLQKSPHRDRVNQATHGAPHRLDRNRDRARHRSHHREKKLLKMEGEV